jgi:hypothetical protein
MPELMGLKNVLVLNDEAHHCYREKPGEEDREEDLKGDDRREAERNRKDMPRKGRGKAEGLDPLALPVRLRRGAGRGLPGHGGR